MSLALKLPWEVIERVISYSDDVETLRSFSLTCRQLRPRSTCSLMAHVQLWDRDNIFEFCEYLHVHSHLRPLVRAIRIDPENFAPFPLLRLLQNLSRITLVAYDQGSKPGSDSRDSLVLHRSLFTSCRYLAKQVQTLELSGSQSWTLQQLSQTLSAFTGVRELVLKDVSLVETIGSTAMQGTEERLTQRLCGVKSLTVSVTRPVAPVPFG